MELAVPLFVSEIEDIEAETETMRLAINHWC